MAESLKLSYNSTLLRVKIELSRSICMTQETPPIDIAQRAKAKMEAIKGSGDAVFYNVYDTRFAEAWLAMRESIDLPPDTKVLITIAAATPNLVGVRVEKAPNEKSIASISIDAPVEVVKTWHYEWFKLFVIKKIRDLGVKDYVNNAQLLGSFLRAKTGEKVTNSLLAALPKLPPGAGPKSFSILANKTRREIAVLIRDVKEVQQPEVRDQMLMLINHSVRQLSGGPDGVQYKVLKQLFMGSLQNAFGGPEILGLDLPMVLLAATGQQSQTAAGSASQGKAPAIQQNYPGMGKLAVKVSQDRMEVHVVDFDLSLYDDPSFEVNADWIDMELKRNGVRIPMSEAIRVTITEAISRHESLTGLKVAAGIVGQGAKGPKLHKTYKDSGANSAANLDADNLDIREMQQRATVKSGQLVAEIRYAQEGVAGLNVLGEELATPERDELILKVGDGIQQRGQKFFATEDGIPTIAGDEIYLSKALVHGGDVNLRTGNIRFDGPVEIKGSIDSGAVVETTGDLLVHGTIRGGFVKVGGTITVVEGIITGTGGRVQCRGDIQADFIENSSVICGGNITVSKAIVSSQIISGGTIRTMAQKTGVVAGGRISCRDTLITQNLGFKNGAVTTLNIGVDWRIAQAVDIRRGRIEKVTKKLGEDRQVLRELVQRTKAQMTPRHQEMKDEIQDKLARGRVLMEKLEKNLADAQAKLTYNGESKILVYETLTSNVHITIGGQIVTVTNDTAGVAVLPKRRRGNFIVAIEEVTESSDGGGRKAS